MDQCQVAVVGAGIVGLAHAWSAAERGHQVTVFERSSRASGGSIRNFGMVWPIGQPAGECHGTAMLSRDRWLKLAQQAGLWVNPCGSIHLAHNDDEWAVLQEFAALAPDLQVSCELLKPEAVGQHTPAANMRGLRGGLLSSSELCVNPCQAVRAIPGWLKSVWDVDLMFDTHIRSVEQHDNRVRLVTSHGSVCEFDRVVICCGAELQVLYPGLLATAGLKLCKLQMMSVRAYETGWKLGPHLASGLTLRHYHNFDVCPSLADVKARIAAESPELDRFGIHVMASQNNDGEIILGDSHEYDSEIEPFDKTLIDSLILRELKKILDLPDWTISQHWHGVYAKYSEGPAFVASPEPNIHIMTGTGGAGMTMSFGLAEKFWQQLSM